MPPAAHPTSVEHESDVHLVERARNGDAPAYGELWRRHRSIALAAARSASSTVDSEELVSEAFTKIWEILKKGGGPTAAFRPYLLVSVRNLAARIGGRNREFATDFPEDVVDESSLEEAADRDLDRGMGARAFRALPPRWQEVLWYTEVEGLSPREVGRILGLAPTAVSMLSMRAREGLRQAWIQAHISAVESDSTHAWATQRMGALARGRLSKRDRARIDRHLSECDDCTGVAEEARRVGSRLHSIVLPVLLGALGALGYSGSVEDGPAAESPSAVVERHLSTPRNTLLWI